MRGLGKRFAPYVSLAVRYDTSDSQIHPTRGFRLLLQDDLAAGFIGSKDASFNRLTLDFRKYMLVFGEKDVFAFRTLVQYIDGDDIPLFDFSTLGGGGVLNAMRGFGLNRFMDKGKFLANVEYRFPIWWKFGGNVFVDMGNVWSRLGDVDWGQTAVDYGLGLRSLPGRFRRSRGFWFQQGRDAALFQFRPYFLIARIFDPNRKPIFHPFPVGSLLKNCAKYGWTQSFVMKKYYAPPLTVFCAISVKRFLSAGWKKRRRDFSTSLCT